MPERHSFTRFLLMGGLALGVLGLILWWTLPFRLPFPPFLLTALLSMSYGGYDQWLHRSTRARKRS